VLVFTDRTLSARRSSAGDAATTPSPIDLSGGWTASFARDRAPVTLETLRSWTDNAATRHFSGVAIYEKTIEVPPALLAAGLRLELDFGTVKPAAAPPAVRFQARVEAPVREAAVVYLNGVRAGSVWCPPYRLDVTGLLRAGENRIKVEVANLALNSMAGQPLPDYTALKARFGDRFQPQDMNQVAPITAGLLGPIRLIARVQPGTP
jgi:hypothetical protein